jgi:hypothetical protein
LLQLTKYTSSVKNQKHKQKNCTPNEVGDFILGQKTQLDRSADEKIVFLCPAQFALMRKTGQLPQLFTN